MKNEYTWSSVDQVHVQVVVKYNTQISGCNKLRRGAER